MKTNLTALSWFKVSFKLSGREELLVSVDLLSHFPKMLLMGRNLNEAPGVATPLDRDK